jgi:toxin FitB
LKRFLLDTNVISELRKSRPHGAVVAWLRALSQEEVFLPSVVFWELQAGIEVTRAQDPSKAQEIEAWVDDLLLTQHIIPMDAASFRECARLMHRKPPELLEDAMIAAIARTNRLVVATRNERDFRLFDVPIWNPFEARS